MFPRFRTGLEVYENLPLAFEASQGFRYLIFDSSDVVLYTLYAGKYLGNFWLGARSFITYKNSLGTSFSGLLSVRKYFESADHYLGIRLSYGNSPDDRTKTYYFASKIITRTKSSGMMIEYNRKFKQKWIINSAFTYDNEEWYPGNYRNVYTFDLSVARLF